MMYCDYIWDSLSLVAGAIMVYRIAKKGRRSITPLLLFYLCLGRVIVIFTAIVMLVGYYHSICPIYIVVAVVIVQLFHLY